MREHSLQKIPAILCIGKREAEEGTVAVRRFGSKAQTTLPLEDFIEQFNLEIEEKRKYEAPASTNGE